MDRFERFLLSRRSIVGSALAVGGLVLHFTGLLGGPFWLPLVAGLYVVGVLLVPAERGLDLAFDAAADADEVRRGLERLVRQVRGRTADDILARVEHIRDSILVTLEAEGGRVAGDPTVRTIRQTALDYLPTALGSYLALPRAYAERRAVAGGRTPHALLLEQLDLMDLKMREAADAILAHDSERLVVNGRFLADRFATSSLRIDAPSPAVADATVTATIAAAASEPARERTAEERAAERERVR